MRHKHTYVGSIINISVDRWKQYYEHIINNIAEVIRKKI